MVKAAHLQTTMMMLMLKETIKVQAEMEEINLEIKAQRKREMTMTRMKMKKRATEMTEMGPNKVKMATAILQEMMTMMIRMINLEMVKIKSQRRKEDG